MLKSIEDLSICGQQEKMVQDEVVSQLKDQNIVDGIHAVSLPPSSSDSRKLIDNVVITKLNLNQQDFLYNELSSMVTEAIFETQKQTNDEIEKKYYEGCSSALNHALYDLKNKCDLYYLIDKYNNIFIHLSAICENFDNVVETNYSQSMIQGLVSTYSNVKEIIKEKLVRQENEIFRQGNIPVVR